MFLDMHLKSPFRQPTWRHDHVMETLDAVKDSPQRTGEDRTIQLYRRFLVALRAAEEDEEDDEERGRVIAAFRNVAAAHQIFHAAEQEQRRQLEARLLTTEPVQEIAARLNTHAYVVDYFEQIFFNVRDRLNARGWVQLMLLKPPTPGDGATNGHFSDEFRWHAYRVFAYHGGPAILDDLVAGFSSVTPKGPSEVASWLDNDLRSTIRRNAAVYAMTLDAADPVSFMKLALETKSLRTANSAAADERDLIDERIAMVIQGTCQKLLELHTTPATPANQS